MPMTPEQIEYELRYFRSAPWQENERRQRNILRLWEIETGSIGDKVLEIGPGPYGGCLPYINAKIKIALDPLIENYWDEGMRIMPRPAGVPFDHEGIRWVKSYIEDIPPDWWWGYFDAAICHNVLEHGTTSFDALDQIVPRLRSGGRLYLQQSIRTEQQLNEAHTHVMRPEDLEAARVRNGLGIVSYKIIDPHKGQDYPYIVAVFERWP